MTGWRLFRSSGVEFSIFGHSLCKFVCINLMFGIYRRAFASVEVEETVIEELRTIRPEDLQQIEVVTTSAAVTAANMSPSSQTLTLTVSETTSQMKLTPSVSLSRPGAVTTTSPGSVSTVTMAAGSIKVSSSAAPSVYDFQAQTQQQIILRQLLLRKIIYSLMSMNLNE